MNIAIFTNDNNIFLYILKELENRNININKNNIVLLSTFELENKKVSFKDETLIIKNINSYNDFENTKIAIFCVKKELTEKYIYNFIENDCVVLDGSDYFIEDDNIPIIDYDINKKNIVKYKNKNIIKLPSQSTLQLVKILNILNKKNKINRVFLSTYQAVSSIGKSAMDELFLHTKKIYENTFLSPINFKKQVPFNVLPQVGDFSINGYSEEELRIIKETKKIINKDLKISVNCSVVPVFNGNCQSISIEFENDFDLNDVIKLFKKNDVLVKINKDLDYSTPKEVSMENLIFVSRLRKDLCCENVLNLWSTADNLIIYAKNIVDVLSDII